MRPELIKSGKVVKIQISDTPCEVLYFDGEWGVGVQKGYKGHGTVYLFHNHPEADGIWTITWQAALSHGCSGCRGQKPPKRAVEMSKLFDMAQYD